DCAGGGDAGRTYAAWWALRRDRGAAVPEGDDGAGHRARGADECDGGGGDPGGVGACKGRRGRGGVTLARLGLPRCRSSRLRGCWPALPHAGRAEGVVTPRRWVRSSSSARVSRPTRQTAMVPSAIRRRSVLTDT